ncbi:GMP/IMP nucleotidase [Thiomicrorhabdus aquaedulcis]|uniref:GMP/IMP nucleotidase n=1 Tax=Thiomicrorhabdus aquaedulcis TaxID=2211106 RepID=UPI001E34CF5D|nr:GMP/IMP nucleotidase [Thiomicrorhabdus aquaedulcis]
MPIIQPHKPLIDWSNIDTVLLDMDGTLLDLHFDWHFWMHVIPHAYAEQNQLALSDAKALIHQKIHSQTGTLNWYCLDYWSATLNLPIAQLKRELKHQIKVHPQVLDFLARLKQLNKHVVMVTNAHRDSLALKLEMTEIGAYFDVLVSAHDFGTPKEDIALWSHLHNATPFNPQRTLLIDDNLHALQSAKDYGIAYLLCATHVSPELEKIDPKDFAGFERYEQIMP